MSQDHPNAPKRPLRERKKIGKQFMWVLIALFVFVVAIGALQAVLNTPKTGEQGTDAPAPEAPAESGDGARR